METTYFFPGLILIIMAGMFLLGMPAIVIFPLSWALILGLILSIKEGRQIMILMLVIISFLLSVVALNMYIASKQNPDQAQQEVPR